jgi:3-oxoacyl-[acyl-carrier protein] reductase
MNLELTDLVALVAGSSKGIGKALATRLLREGCRVCVTGRNATELEKTRVELHREFGERILSAEGDLTDPAAIQKVLDLVANAWNRLDILVANIGTGSGKPGWQNDEAEWQRLFGLNFFGSVRLAQSSVPLLRSRGGSILFVGSIAGLEASPAPLPYSAAKAALVNYSKNLARVLAADKIRVNCLCPGNVLFPGGSWEKHLSNRNVEVQAYISTEVPQQRFGSPEEIASFAAYLLSPVSGFATGGVYVMDGGQTRGY